MTRSCVFENISHTIQSLMYFVMITMILLVFSAFIITLFNVDLMAITFLNLKTGSTNLYWQNGACYD